MEPFNNVEEELQKLQQPLQNSPDVSSLIESHRATLSRLKNSLQYDAKVETFAKSENSTISKQKLEETKRKLAKKLQEAQGNLEIEKELTLSLQRCV